MVSDELKKLFSDLELDKILGEDISSFYTVNEGIIRERQEIFKDLFENDNLFCDFEDIYVLLNSLINSFESIGISKESSLNSVLTVNAYITFIEESYNKLKHYSLKSSRLNEFLRLIKKEKENKNFDALKENCSKITNDIKKISSVTIGINLDPELRPIEAGLVSVNANSYRSGNLMDKIFSASFNSPKDYECLCPLSELGKSLSHDEISGFNYKLNKVLDKIITKGFKGLSKQSSEYITSACHEFSKYKNTFSFYIKGVRFFKDLKQSKIPITIPEISRNDYKINEMHNYRIVMSKGIKYSVANSIHFDGNTRIFVLTGPNSGGKSVFLEALVFNQLLFQIGFPILANNAQIVPFENIFVYSSSDFKNKNLYGRFENEVKWFSEKIKECTNNDLFIMDELFSGTSCDEAKDVSFSALKMISKRNAKGIFSTHIHELAKRIAFDNEPDFDNLSINSNYTVTRDIPNSYESKAITIAKKYGIVFTT